MVRRARDQGTAFTREQAPEPWQAWADRLALAGVRADNASAEQFAALVEDANRAAGYGQPAELQRPVRATGPDPLVDEIEALFREPE